MMREMFLDDLPRQGKFINWKESIGRKVKFIYEEIKGEVEIVSYDDGYLSIVYFDNTYSIKTGNFTRCIFGKIVGKYNFNYEFKYNVGDILESVNSGKLKILEQIREERGTKGSKGRFYLYECLTCGNIDKIFEYSISISNNGCGVCANKKIKIGFNDMWTTNPELGVLLWNHDDGYKYTFGSKKKLDWKCPDCNEKVSNKEIYSVRDQGLSCPKCSDGVSYPNKLMYNVLVQSGIEFINEWSPMWAKIKSLENKSLTGSKRYDFYIPTLNCAIEMHGSQHYIDTRRNNGRTFKEEQENDKLKENLLSQNGIDYVVINAEKSDLEHIKDNILKSKLSMFIDFNTIDWIKCDKHSSKSLMVEVCNLKNKGMTTTEIILKIKLNKSTIIRYLKRGTKLGMCNYDAIEEAIKSRIKGNAISAEVSKKVVLQFSLNSNLLNEFESGREAAKSLDISPSLISASCLGKQKSAGGYIWIYKEDYESRGLEINAYKKNTRSKNVVRMSLSGEYMDEYESVVEAERQLGIKRSNITSVCRGEQKTSSGFKWAYKEEYSKCANF